MKKLINAGLLVLLNLLACASAYAVLGDGTIPHFADGGPWTTTFTLVNTSAGPDQVTISFSGDNGSPVNLTLIGRGHSNSFTVALPARGSVTLETDGSSPAVTQGYATISSRSVTGTAIFRQRIAGKPDYEAASPISQPTTRILFQFDNTEGSVCGFALVNTGDTQSAIVAIRDEAGTILLLTTGGMRPYQHVAYSLPDAYPVTANKRGTIEILATRSNSIVGLLLRFNPTGPITTLTPAYAGN